MRQLSVILAVSWCACSPMTSGSDGGAGGGVGSTAGGLAAGGGATSGGAAGGVAGGTVFFGSVTVSQSRVQVGSQSFTTGMVIGSFLEIPTQLGGCTRTQAGPCVVSDCSAIADAGFALDAGFQSAGTLTVSGLIDGGVTLMPGAQGYQQAFSRALFNAGDSIAFSASGATVPAFSAQVTAPQELQLTAPACTSSSCGSVSKASDLSLAWTGGSNEVIAEFLLGNTEVSCTFPASAHAATVPAAAFAGASLGTGTMLLLVQNKTSTRAGPYTVLSSVQQSIAYQVTLTP